jgi:RNA-splicing ligase RtcB
MGTASYVLLGLPKARETGFRSIMAKEGAKRTRQEVIS